MSATLPRHGGQLRAVAQQFGLATESLLDLSANINPAGPPVGALAAMQVALAGGDCLTLYPDLDEAVLKHALATYAGVSSGQVVVANGFVPLLDAAVRALGVRSCLVPVPAFNEYRRVLEQNGVEITPAPLQPGSSFRYDLSACLPTACDAILLANPQNPTGVLCAAADLLAFVTQAGEAGKYVFLDEAFIDYTPEDSLAGAIGGLPNLVVFRSLTKFFGMPGLRVAYALAEEKLCTKIERWVAPWSVTSLASIAAVAAESDHEYARTAIEENATRRSAMRNGLEHQGATVMPGAANFLFFKTETSQLWSRLIAEHRIALRSCDNYENLAAGYCRAAVLGAGANARLVNALASLRTGENPTR